MHRRATLSSVVFLALVATTSCRRPVGAPLPPPTPCRGHAFGIGARDVLTVSVFSEDHLSGTYRVSEEGRIDYPYLGRIFVVGLQPGDVADLIRNRLGEQTETNPDGQNVLRDPSVRVELSEVNSRRISVFGQVQHPGVFPHQQCLTISQAISLAGGFTALAEKNQVRVTRRDRAGNRRTFVLHVEDIAEGRAPDFDIEPGDVIFVPESIT